MPNIHPPDAPNRCRIEIAGLRKSFLAEGREVVAVDDASFRIDDGEFVALLGPSGCGKSTILNMVATLIAPNGGDIRVDDAPVIPGRPIRHVGYVFQKDTLFPWRTVEGNIGYALELAGVAMPERRARVDQAIHQAGLDGFARFYPSSLSGGMRQRVSLMRTLIAQPEILLMDEPFGALDTHTKLDMHSVLLDLWEHTRQTVLFVTHDLGEALTLADRIILMSARPGRVKQDFKVDFPRPRDAVALRETRAIRRAVLAHLAFAGRGIRQRPQRMRRLSTLALADRLRPRRARDLAMGLGAARRRCRGWCRTCSIPTSSPSLPTIYQQFLRMGCLVSSDGQWTFNEPGAFARCIGKSENNLWIATYFTLKNTLWGFATGVSSGFALGLLLGRSDRLSEIFYPYITAFNSIPRIALAPIIILAFGIGDASKIVTAWLVVVFLVFFNTFEGARSVDRDHINAARLLGAGEWQVTKHGDRALDHGLAVRLADARRLLLADRRDRRRIHRRRARHRPHDHRGRGARRGRRHDGRGVRPDDRRRDPGVDRAARAGLPAALAAGPIDRNDLSGVLPGVVA